MAGTDVPGDDKVDPEPPMSGAASRQGGTAVLTGPSRLAAVARARHLLEASGGPLDRLARLAADGGHAPIGIVSLLDDAHEHFVGTHGTRLTGVPVSRTLCQHVVGTDLPLVIDDLAGMDVGAARAAGVAAYAGFPVHLGGAAVGAVCVADGRPRRWTATELDAVSDAAGMVSAMLAERDAAATGPAPTGPTPTSGYAAMLRGFGDGGPARTFLDGLLSSLATTVVACDAQGRLVLADEGMAVLGGAPDRWPHRQDACHPDGRPMRTGELPLMRALAGERLNSVPLLLRQPAAPDRYYLCNGCQLVDDSEVLGAVVVIHEVTTMVRVGQFKDCEVAVSRVLESDPEFDHAVERVLDLVLGTLRWPHAELWRTSGSPADLRRCTTASYTGSVRAAGPPATPGPGGHAHVTDGIDGPPAPANELARRACERGRPVWTTDEADGSVRPTLAVPVRSADRTLGVLTLFASTVDDQPELLEDLLTGVATHIGMFIERSRVAKLAQALANSKDEYIGLVGHEMRTPLTSISAYTDLVIEDPGLSDDVRSMLEVVQRNAAALRAIISNLLDLAAFDSGHARVQLNPTDVSDLVRAAVDEAAAPGGPPLTADIQPGLLVAADVPRLRQAVDNLLSNALRYTPDGAVVVKLAVHGETGVLEVADTGIGIPRNERSKLFGRFFRGRNAKGMGIPGSGLGLAIARAIVEAHNGTLEFVERPGPGSTFRLRIPLAN